MEFNSLEDGVSFLFDDDEDMEYMVATPDQMDLLIEKFLDYLSCIEWKPVATSGEADPTAQAGAPVGEAGEALREERQVGDLSVASEVSAAPSAAAGGAERGRKRNAEEFRTRRPDWLPEGWTTDYKTRATGASKDARDRVTQLIGPFL